MRGNGYLARWVSAITAEGPVRAITFVVKRGSERYAGRLSDQEIADQIALACGQLHGSLPIQVLDHYALENEPSLTEFPRTPRCRILPLGRSSEVVRRVPPPPYAAHVPGGYLLSASIR
jgi:hypothetical protein